jgi:hypothetical protein
MAAILCKTIGELFSALGQVLTIPCKALGIGCDAMSDVLRSPFFPYLAVTFALNVPAVVYAIRGLGGNCPELVSWLFCNGLLGLIHMLASMYVVNKIRESSSTDNNSSQKDEEEGRYYTTFTDPKENEHGASNSCSRIKHVLCYDKTMAVYIFASIPYWVVWLSVGIKRRQGAEGNCGDLIHFMNVAISCGYTYMSMVGMAFACSLCCLR